MFQREDYVLRWPRELFRTRLTELLDGQLRGTFSGNWPDVLDHLLFDAFESELPAQDMHRAAQNSGSPGRPMVDATGAVCRRT